MALLHEDLIKKIYKSCAYCDEKSFEKYTGKTKRKYKLAGNPIVGLYLGQYVFHHITHVKDAYIKEVTLTINKADWKYRAKDPQYLKEDFSYCDLSKHDILTREELSEKIIDKENGFKYAARLCASKCEELLKINHRYQRYYDIPKEIREIVGASLDDDSLDRILRKLELK